MLDFTSWIKVATEYVLWTSFMLDKLRYGKLIEPKTPWANQEHSMPVVCFKESFISWTNGIKRKLKKHAKQGTVRMFKWTFNVMHLSLETKYKYFQQVWKVYLSHKLPNLSNKYFLVLALCFQPGCPHSLCMAGNKEQSCWYQCGPPLTYFPLPVPDPAKPWGGDCSSCKGQCPGHYMKPHELSQCFQGVSEK